MDESYLLNLNIANQALYNTKKYQTITGAQGAPGAPGSSSNTGAPGAAGVPGTPGSAVNTGASGTTGYTGLSGTPGSQGATGTPGSAVNTGATGYTGRIGYTGFTGQQGVPGGPGGPTGDKGPTGDPGLVTIPYGIIKIPAGTANFNFSLANSTLPSSFGLFNPGTATDGITFTITLNGKYNTSNLPFYNLTAYVYSSTSGYVNCQRQLGAQSGVAAAYITMNSTVTTITFNYISKTNFPYTANDPSGYALYICFNILN